MAYTFADRVWFFTSSTGTGTINVGAALAGYQQPIGAGLATGNDVGYTIVDGFNWEAGTGTLTSGGTWTLSRDIVEQSSSGTTKISLSGAATCFITAAAGVINAAVGIVNIAALRASRSLMANVVQVAGYYTAADGGEGRFILAETDTTSADNGGTIIVDASGRRWYRATEGKALSIRWFGAKGDNTTNDTAAIQAAFNVGGAIHIPNGQFIVNAASDACLVITKLVVLKGDGFNSVIKTAAGLATVDVITLRPPSAGVMWGTILQDFTIDGTAGRHALRVDLSATGPSLAFSQFNGLQLIGGAGDSWHLDNTNLNGFFISKIQDCYCTNTISLLNSGDSIQVVHNTVIGTGVCIDMSSEPGAASCVLSHNNLVADGGAMVLYNVAQAKVLYNQCEQAYTYTGATSGQIALETCFACLVADNNLNAFDRVTSNVVIGSSSSDNIVTRNVLNVKSSLPAFHVIVGAGCPRNVIAPDNTFLEYGVGEVMFPTLLPIPTDSPTLGVFNGPLALQLGWIAGTDPGVRQGLYFTRDPSGRVTVSGNVRNGTVSAGAILTNLPLGFRPRVATRGPFAAVFFNGTWTACLMRFNTNGDVAVDSIAWPGNSDVQIDASFMAF